MADMRQTIDAAAFQQMVIHAALALRAQRQQINDLNVFPVPDGDTGTNMSLTIGAASAALNATSYETVGQVAQGVASALLRGARGNSGVILSLLFRGFAKAIKDRQTIDGRDLALALDFGVDAAYRAVMKPAEGTILTVSRMAAAQAAQTARETGSFEEVLASALEAGEQALAQTIHQNPVLKKAGVVDAGGKGFLVILQGMLDQLHGLPMPQVEADQEEIPEERAEFSAFSTEDIQFGYCTEFICSRDSQKDPKLLQQFCQKLGDSLVLVEDDDIIKVHVHTNEPGTVLQEALTYGALLKVKIENMREQHTEILAEAAQKVPAPAAPADPEKQYGSVAVCAGKGLESVFRDLGVDRIISGGQTMNPSTEDILQEIQNTPARVVLVLPNNKNIILAAQQCIPLCEEKQVVVLPTKSIPQGISALLTADFELPQEELIPQMTQAMESVSTVEITCAARDSDFDGLSIHQGDYMALVNHQLTVSHPDLSQLLSQLLQREPFLQAGFISIFYGEDVSEEEAQHTADQITAACPEAEVSLLSGGQPVYPYIISVE